MPGSVLPGCGDEESALSDPSDTAMAFVTAYDRWARQGFPQPLPNSLSELSNESARAALESDARWYSRGNVRQVGSIAFDEARVMDSDDTSSTVSLSADYSQVELTADGREADFDQGQGSVLEVHLVRGDRGRRWVVDSISRP